MAKSGKGAVPPQLKAHQFTKGSPQAVAGGRKSRPPAPTKGKAKGK